MISSTSLQRHAGTQRLRELRQAYKRARRGRRHGCRAPTSGARPVRNAGGDGRWRSAIRTGGIVRGCSIRPSGESGMRAERSCVCVCPNLFSRVSCSRKAVHTLAFCRDPGGAVLIMLMVLCAGVSRPDPALDYVGYRLVMSNFRD